ncbi:MAG: hypothetical protein JGK12_11470 [Microcoleus sp. PH2017_01_SCD_O_A]|uniref:hypothetical protein n=1 Tax=unclassified Microcoleus TaxID=2642155 RepID=UPI001D8B2A22|nr:MULTISPECIES: hypothetical protein [unclassified Microcoleus]MCC3431245.1 hypothetical protein [Microcoleus sp. PH2017_04_SCI_O_A]MCC3512282.1 hypothetical protein [Microcoleus sp. PH2017_17_BER_D_A]MCC3534177.1 hypothetical protein [Microcoleus sp. PH2017_25_DOB_D_A]MCC3575087.1 hypothetical protein [Microcoleus sp. PH2017_34_RAT_O_A]MCC3612699.1 hypothetical protein [Microcoleus sp. PH2017_40_RAT_O_B]MCC3631997.1 hypothetical protein [Microcoleus sp. PH2017_39_LGB_O_B]TAE41839.1 MAG: hy
MNPSPNRSSKSSKSTSARKAQPTEPAVNQPAVTASVPETPDESPVSSASAAPVDQNQPPAPTDAPATTDAPAPNDALAPTDAPATTDAPAPKDTLQRPRYSSAPDGDKTKPKPSDAPAISEPAAPAESAGKTTELTVVPTPTPKPPTNETQVDDDDIPSVMRQHPIPPPSEPRQYRAVGLVRGRYTQSEEQFTRGMLIAADGTAIDAVLLGRVMSLVKNHLDLEQEHLWVVYPRTRQEDGNLHAQIMGVWEPETLKKSPETSSDEENQEAGEIEQGGEPSTASLPPSEPDVEDGYFSIRGEVIYQQSQEEEKYLIVKIKQAPRKNDDKMKFFKLKLKGDVGTKAIGFFWDFHVKLQADSLMIEQANNIGALPIKKRKFPPGSKPPGGGYKGGGNKRAFTPKPSGDGTPVGRPTIKSAAAPPVPKEPLPKPVKKPKLVEE